ncbi:MAG: hypothetical protein IOD05_10440 [Rhodobacter sp.]|nr:hypothetical protein [Rhodobacter sp.]MCA3495017.1 hypothetical protein [Rhodobacter sp.]MCA3499894.1 hypothetical protein [Rhodobacter sp.]MCA3503645.1 hypothetical protein [Rhodobacter sp.]MCA3516842.1 hypothetical protein [Rhodobacter sp.]
MQKVVRVLACCLVLAGCTEEEQEFSGEIEAASLDLTQPVPGGTVYITCGPIEGVEMYPLDLDPFLPVRGGYEIFTTNSAIVPKTNGPFPQAFLNFENSRSFPNTNFFITGLKDGCTAVLSAVGMRIMLGDLVVDSPYTVQLIPGSTANGIRFSSSDRVDDEIWNILRGREGYIDWLDLRNLRRNAIVLSFSYQKAGSKYDWRSSVMILDRVAFADYVVRVKG